MDLQGAATNTGFAAGDAFVGIEDLYGSFQSDSLMGNSDGNIIWGASGNDLVDGRLGNDTLIGGTGNDTLIGGGGADVFVFSPGTAGEHDVVADFLDGVDRLQLSGVANYAALVVVAGAGGAVVSFGALSVIIQGLSPLALTEADFIFV